MEYSGISLPEPEEGAIVLGAVVLMKMMKPTGEIIYREHTSDTLHPVEMLGMATTFQDTLKAVLMTGIRTNGGEAA